MAKFIEINDEAMLDDTIINVNEIVTINIKYEDTPDYMIRKYAKKEGITEEEARESGEIFQNVYYIKLTNGDTLKTNYINHNCPELDELLSLLNELNA